MSYYTGGRSGNLINLFDQLRAWVENGTKPENIPVDITDLTGALQYCILCPYPQRAIFDKGCGASAEAQC
jgi:hypothetical protein